MALTRISTLVAVAGIAALSAACGQPDSQDSSGATTTNATGVSLSSPADNNSTPLTYEASVQQFQRDREAALKADDGWLTVAGLFFLSQPSTTFGSDPLNDFVLPESAPKQAGTFELRDGKVQVKAATGVTFQLGNKAVTSAELESDAKGTPDRIGLGDLQLWVHLSGNRLSIRLRDPNNLLRKEFTGTQWFPVDQAYRVEAQYVPYDKPKIIQVPNILGDIDSMPVPGVVTFMLNGQPLKLEPISDPGDKEFWFVFRDLTSGKETYGAARFLYSPAPVDGKMILDFNMAENPPCAYNSFTTCPLPPEQNRLRVRVEAGEKTYAGHSEGRRTQG